MKIMVEELQQLGKMAENKKNHPGRYKKQKKGEDPIMKEGITQKRKETPKIPMRIKSKNGNIIRLGFSEATTKNVPLQTRK